MRLELLVLGLPTANLSSTSGSLPLHRSRLRAPLPLQALQHEDIWWPRPGVVILVV